MLDKHLGIILIILLPFAVLSQEMSEIKSIEVNSPWLELIPVDNQGFLMFEYQAVNLENNQVGLIVSRYDMELNKVWDSMLPFDKKLQLTWYQVSDGHLFIVLSDQKKQKIEVFKLDVNNAKGYQQEYQFSNPFDVSMVLAKGSRTWIAGKMRQHGVLFELEPNSSQYRTLPTAYVNLVNEVSGVQYHEPTNILSFILKTTINKQESCIFRGIDISKNKVVFDIELQAEQKYHLDQVKYLHLDQGQVVMGTLYKKDAEQTEGLFQFRLERGEIVSRSLRLFKDIPGFYQYQMAEDESEIFTSRNKSVTAQVDHMISDSHGVVISLDVMEKQYQAKGALQQEFEQSYLVNYLDQDQSGRRGFDQTSSFGGISQSAEDRIYQGSATDILSYRYRNAIISQPMFQGYQYQRTVIIQFQKDMEPLSCVSIQGSKSEVNFLQISNSYQELDQVRQWYDQGGLMNTWLYNPQTMNFSTFNSVTYLDGNGRLFHLGSGKYLGTNLEQQENEIFLHLQIVTL
jgi:hypothetical protein